MTTQHPKCPFYPDSCEVERHPNQQHKWKGTTAKKVAEEVVRPVLHVTNRPITNAVTNITNTPQITNKPAPADDSEKVIRRADAKMAKVTAAREWNQANREKYNARQREYMAKRRAEKREQK